MFKAGDRVRVKQITGRNNQSAWLWSGMKGTFNHSDEQWDYFIPDFDATYSDGSPLRAEYRDKPCGMGKSDLELDPDVQAATISEVRKLDTSELGPVKLPSHNDIQTQAKVVRDALRATGDWNLGVAAGLSSDESLAHLRRLLK